LNTYPGSAYQASGEKAGDRVRQLAVLRRSFATWLKMAGADAKDAQALMRQ
jgi:hypothetical protein